MKDPEDSVWRTQRTQRIVRGGLRWLRGQCVEDSEDLDDSMWRAQRTQRNSEDLSPQRTCEVSHRTQRTVRGRLRGPRGQCVDDSEDSEDSVWRTQEDSEDSVWRTQEDSEDSVWRTQRTQRTVCGGLRGHIGQCVEDQEDFEDSVWRTWRTQRTLCVEDSEDITIFCRGPNSLKKNKEN